MFSAKLLLSLLHWIQGKAEEIPIGSLPRQRRRALERSGHITPVTVLRLRHLDQNDDETSDQEGHPVDWTHRWVVSPHWRQQAYGPQRSLRRSTFIAPYIKGPADKPLIYKDRVWQVDR